MVAAVTGGNGPILAAGPNPIVSGSLAFTMSNANGILFQASSDGGTPLVNYIVTSARVAGSGPIIDFLGGDTNVAGLLRTKGSGNFAILNGNGTLASYNSNGAAATDHPTFFAGTSVHNSIMKASGVTNIAIGGGVLATSATAGYLVTPSCAGLPTGVPVLATLDGVPRIYDTTNQLDMVFTGGQWQPASGRRMLFTTGAVVGNAADLTVDTLASFTMAAAQLKNVGDIVRIRCNGRFASSTDVKTAVVKLGNQTLTTTTSVNGVVIWWVEIDIMKTGASTQTFATMGGMNGTGNSGATNGTATQTDSGTLVILVTGQNATNSVLNSVTLQFMSVEYIANGA